MVAPFYTIGHGTRPLHQFVELLNNVAVTLVVDVRSVPRSRTNPQYNRDTLPRSLARFEIGYEHIASLGGLRGRTREVPPQLNAFWENASFHNYADYALCDQFLEGLSLLRQLGHERHCAIMCAETVWWRCHRRIITDYLLAADRDVFHIIDKSVPEPASLTPGARAVPAGLAYPAPLGI